MSRHLLALAFIAIAAPAQAFTIVLDPGHGGADPGAEAAGLREADIVLDVAEKVAGELQMPGVKIVFTRRDDSFLGLSERLAVARAAKADLFVSIHADSTGGGRASGLSVYSFQSDKGPGVDAYRLTTLPQSKWIAGVDVPEGGGDLGPAMVDMARTRSTTETARLSAALVTAFRAEGLGLAGRPERQQGFTVLTAAEMPSILLELGFLSSDFDRARITSPEWQERAARAVAAAITTWRDDAGGDFDG